MKTLIEAMASVGTLISELDGFAEDLHGLGFAIDENGLEDKKAQNRVSMLADDLRKTVEEMLGIAEEAKLMRFYRIDNIDRDDSWQDAMVKLFMAEPGGMWDAVVSLWKGVDRAERVEATVVKELLALIEQGNGLCERIYKVR